MIGDELMALIDDPAAAIQFAIELSLTQPAGTSISPFGSDFITGRPCSVATTGSGPPSTSLHG